MKPTTLRTGLLLLCVSWAATAAPPARAAASGAAILRVNVLSDAAGPRNDYPALAAPRMGTKFSGRDIVAGEEQFEVYWRAPAGGLSAGAVLLLEYYRRYSDTPHGLKKKFSLPVAGEQKSLFQINDDARLDGPIARWRVRLVHKGRVLAESATPNWR